MKKNLFLILFETLFFVILLRLNTIWPNANDQMQKLIIKILKLIFYWTILNCNYDSSEFELQNQDGSRKFIPNI